MHGGRKIGGILRRDEIKFVFRVWAFRAVTEQELQFSYRAWLQKRDKRRKLDNQTIDWVASYGAR